MNDFNVQLGPASIGHGPKDRIPVTYIDIAVHKYNELGATHQTRCGMEHSPRVDSPLGLHSNQAPLSASSAVGEVNVFYGITGTVAKVVVQHGRVGKAQNRV